MKRVLIVILQAAVALAAGALSANNPPTTTPLSKTPEHQRLKLKGHVKSVVETTTYDRDDQHKGQLRAFTRMVFDRSGNITLLVERNRMYNRETGYVYDDRKNIAALRYFDTQGRPDGKKEFVYDEKGEALRAVSTNKGGDTIARYTFTHNLPDDMAEEKEVRYDLEKHVVWISRYDNAGNMVEFNNGYTTTQFTYDEKGNLIESVTGEYQRIVNEYNEAGEIVRTTDTYGDDVVVYTFTYTSRDAAGNWTQRQELKNDTPHQTTKRVVEYY